MLSVNICNQNNAENAPIKSARALMASGAIGVGMNPPAKNAGVAALRHRDNMSELKFPKLSKEEKQRKILGDKFRKAQDKIKHPHLKRWGIPYKQ